MKNWKKYAAIIGVIVLLVIFCLPMYFALKGDFSQKEFMASLFTVMFVAVMCYVILMLFKYLNKKKDGQEKSSMIKNVVFDVGLVLVEFNWQDYLDSFGFDEEKRERIAKATFQSPVWDERDRGLYDEETLCTSVSGTGTGVCRRHCGSDERYTKDGTKDAICGNVDQIPEKPGLSVICTV